MGARRCGLMRKIGNIDAFADLNHHAPPVAAIPVSPKADLCRRL
jgi:hypothetical protein